MVPDLPWQAASCAPSCWVAAHGSGTARPLPPQPACSRRPQQRPPGLHGLRPCAAVVAGLVARRAAAAEEPAAPAPRRRRRRKRASAAGGSELQLELAERRKVVCDCDLIYDTVVELDGILSDAECECLIDAACERAAKVGWGEVRHSNYATQDVKIWNMGSRLAVSIFRDRLVEPMRERIAEHFGLPLAAVQVDDGFVVRYMEGAQRSLSFHRDGSIVSGIVSLSASSEYEGGGTSFRDGSVYRPEKGCGILFGGQRLHSGVEITGGSRYICTLFFKCGDFSCRDVAVARDAEVDGDKFMGEVNQFFGGLFGGA